MIPVIGCRPFIHIPKTEEQEEEFRDRKPLKAEVDNCIDRVHDYIYAIDPEIVVLMGEHAWKAVADRDQKYTNYTSALSASTMLNISVPGVKRVANYPAVVTPGPEECLKNPNAADHGPAATAIRLLTDLRDAFRHMKENRCPHR